MTVWVWLVMIMGLVKGYGGSCREGLRIITKLAWQFQGGTEDNIELAWKLQGQTEDNTELSWQFQGGTEDNHRTILAVSGRD